MYLGHIKDWLWVHGAWVRMLAGIVFLLRGALFQIIGQRYKSMTDLCRVVRISGDGVVRRVAYRAVMRAVHEIKFSHRNFLEDAYLDDSASRKCANLYAISGEGSHDIFRDVIVLKRATPDERGVILLKYGRTFEAMFAIFDMERLMAHYQFVLEPCWAGYCDPAILMFLRPGHSVIIQVFTEDDYRFIASIGPPFFPVRLGPADWVDADLMQPDVSTSKLYDLVMVANWAAHKRHRQLFSALRSISDRKLRVLLIGFPWGGRSADDIRQESLVTANPNVSYEIVESIPSAEVARYLRKCRVFVFLSRKEGDNKALVEAMFANVPAVVYEGTIGGARSRINPKTGRLSSDRDLAKNIIYILENQSEFAPRDWALEHTGSKVATRVLDDMLARVAVDYGTQYTRGIIEKTNSPNLAYKDPEKRSTFQDDYAFILSCKRAHAWESTPTRR